MVPVATAARQAAASYLGRVSTLVLFDLVRYYMIDVCLHYTGPVAPVV